MPIIGAGILPTSAVLSKELLLVGHAPDSSMCIESRDIGWKCRVCAFLHYEDAMSLWNDHNRWAAPCSGTACPICCCPGPLDVVAKLEVCWVAMQEAAPAPGYACLVSQNHAVELHDLSEAAATAFMRVPRRVSRALTAATGSEVELRNSRELATSSTHAFLSSI